ncbi:MAG: cupin domain-containing protein [Rhizobiaceae bacterium]|nr:cupin domain-containing protein [Rhizobiaceae bacterium]
MSEKDAKHPIANTADLKLLDFANGGRFSARLGPISKLIGLKQIGCMYMQVEPGKTAFPFHVHHANEEMFIILEGEGEYRFGEDVHALKSGDVVAAPAGGPEFAHQIINTGKTTMKYFSISTRLQPEVVEYPDSNKFGVYSRMEDGTPLTAKFRHLGRLENAVDYWDGEE